MTRFEQTVQKLASAPWKQALLKEAGLPRLLTAPKNDIASKFAPKNPVTEMSEKIFGRKNDIAGKFAPKNPVERLSEKVFGPKHTFRPKMAAFPFPQGPTWGQRASAFGQGAKRMGQQFVGEAADYLSGDAGKDVAKTMLGAASAGGAAYIGGRLMSDNDSDSARNEARYKELGKLEAQGNHRQEQLKKFSPLHQAMLGQVSGNDEILSKADPALLQSSYDTMRRFAPTLATDPNATRAFLQEVATYGKPPSYATLKLLADTEGSVMKTYGGFNE